MHQYFGGGRGGFIATRDDPKFIREYPSRLFGIAPTANLNPERRTPSMFEPIHGSAFDITGKGIANPLGAFWTASMMLEHLGEAPAAQRLMRAVEAVTARGDVLTPDLGGTATTEQVTEAVIAALKGVNI